MASLFCCTGIKPYRPQYLSNESKFESFLVWAAFPNVASPDEDTACIDELLRDKSPNVIQLVRQINYGPLESKRYFLVCPGGDEKKFREITETTLIEANYQKLNTYKNFKCDTHNKFFEVNLYQKDPVNKHHWRANIARPSGDIDLNKPVEFK